MVNVDSKGNPIFPTIEDIEAIPVDQTALIVYLASQISTAYIYHKLGYDSDVTRTLEETYDVINNRFQNPMFKVTTKEDSNV